jgi:hypothetical protein
MHVNVDSMEFKVNARRNAKSISTPIGTRFCFLIRCHSVPGPLVTLVSAYELICAPGRAVKQSRGTCASVL